MSNRWQHRIVEVPYKLFDKQTERAQAELDRLGQQGWELVAVVQSNVADAIRMFFKKPA